MNKVLTAAIAICFLSSFSATADEKSSVCMVSKADPSLSNVQGLSTRSWIGSESFAASIPPSGVWYGMGPEHDFSDKLFWVAEGFKPGLESDFSLTGRHLYIDAITPIISEPGNARSSDLGGWAILVGVGFPATGCWELTGSYQGQSVTFTVNVISYKGVASGH